MNPVDLGEAFRLTLENPAAVGERFVIGCYTPYTATDAAGLRSMPAAIVDRYYPGASALLEELGIQIPPVPYYFSHEKARTRLGFRSQHELGDLVRMYREWKRR
jgi:nucleoside-diphosphate-sugar epimerase